jgi:hypothetical protein
MKIELGPWETRTSDEEIDGEEKTETSDKEKTDN